MSGVSPLEWGVPNKGKMNFTNKRVTIIGLSGSGFSAVKLLKKLNAKVRISELRDEEDVRTKLKELGEVEFEIGTNTSEFIEKSNLIVVSPGVPLDIEPLRNAARKGIPIIGELELGYMLSAAPIIAVTGTNGKSTTASLLHKMLEINKVKSYLLGNIGRPICEDILDITSDSVITLEVSSFQLETIKRFRPKIAILLNITQNHLDRYRDMEQYKKAKFRIFENQKDNDYAILNYDDPATRELLRRIKSKIFYFSVKQKVKGGYIEDNRLFIDIGRAPQAICHKGDVSLIGTHNLGNILAAAIALKLINDETDVLPVVKSFIGLRHRLEPVAEIEGVKFVDDSKSTTVDSTLRALEIFSEDNVILIAGGKDKGNDNSPIDYSLIKSQINKLKYLILIGEARKKIRGALGDSELPIKETSTIEEAVLFARRIAKEGDTVLLSPMCSSFDMFKDYKERGEVFRSAVLDMLSGTKNHEPIRRLSNYQISKCKNQNDI